MSIIDIRSWLGDPAIFVLDCSGAGVLLSRLIDGIGINNNPANNRSSNTLYPGNLSTGNVNPSSNQNFQSTPVPTLSSSYSNILDMPMSSQIGSVISIQYSSNFT